MMGRSSHNSFASVCKRFPHRETLLSKEKITRGQTGVPVVRALHETPKAGLFLPTLHFLPGDVECLQHALDGALERPVEHLVPVYLELLGHLVGVLEADDVLSLLELAVQGVRLGVEALLHLDALEERGMDLL